MASGGNQSLALRADGTVWARGSNSFNQLGDDRCLGGWASPGPRCLVAGTWGRRSRVR
nr:hypothetical protein [Cystobacter fuscus]